MKIDITPKAPISAKYIVQTADGILTSEQALGALATGLLKNTTTTGILSIAAAGDIPDLSATYAVVNQTMYIGTTAVAINRASAALTLAGITLTTPDIGTPSAGTLTSCTGLPVAGITASTVTALGVGSIELGHASDTTIARVSAGVVSIEGVNILTVAGGTLTGDLQLGETDIKLDALLSGDETWSGITTTGTAGSALVVGDVCYLANTGKWLIVDGILDGTDTGFSKQLGICVLAAGADTNPTEMLLYGKVRSAAFPVFTVGSAVYLSDTAGDLIVAQPSSVNFCIRIVGYALTAEDLFWNPSNDWIIHI